MPAWVNPPPGVNLTNVQLRTAPGAGLTALTIQLPIIEPVASSSAATGLLAAASAAPAARVAWPAARSHARRFVCGARERERKIDKERLPLPVGQLLHLESADGGMRWWCHQAQPLDADRTEDERPTSPFCGEG